MKKLFPCMLLWLCIVQNSWAQTQTLLQKADVALRGRVTFVKPFQNERGQIYTRVVINPAVWYKGTPKDALVVEVPGGILADRGVWVSHTPIFQIQEEVVIFYNEVDNVFVDGEAGKYTLQNGFVPHEKLKVDQFDEMMQLFVQSPIAHWERISNRYKRENPSKTTIALTSFMPAAAAAGTGAIITLNGNGFGNTQGAGKVAFNKDGMVRVEAPVVSWSDTQIKVTVPATTSSGTIQITNNGGDVVTSVSAFQLTFGAQNRKWKGENASITYQINPNTPDLVGEETAVQNAMNTWNAVNSRFQFLYGGIGAATSYMANQNNDIYWVANIDGMGGIVARNWNYYDPATGTIYESDIEFDESESWTIGAGAATQDVETVALHELGHSLHLSDYYDIADNDKVMYGIAPTGVIKRLLHANDVAGLNALYAAPSATESPSRGGFFNTTGTQILASLDKPAFAAGATSDFLTVEAWIYPTALPGSGGATIVAQTRGTMNRGFELLLNTLGKIEFRASLNGTSVTTVSSTSTIALNQWTHVRGVFRKSTSNNNRFIYVVINGANEATVAAGANPLFDSSANLTIGGYFNFAGQMSSLFQGKIDEVLLTDTNRLLSTITPSTLATTATTPASLGATTGFRGLWKFDETISAKTENVPYYYDVSGNGNVLNLTATNLAVQLATFTASIQSDEIQLRWKTASETDFYGFEIEQREGRKEGVFKTVAFVAATGLTHQEAHYDYKFFDTTYGYHTFRLKMIDKDGTVKYSEEIIVYKELPDAFVLSEPYPNPFPIETRLKLNVARTQDIEVKLYNSIGQAVKSLFKGEVSANEHKFIDCNAQSLAAGLYIVKVKGAYFETSKEIIFIP